MLTDLVRRYDDPTTPYRAVRRRGFNYGFDPYAHLARVAERSGGESGDAADDGDEPGQSEGEAAA
jgi:hypothetical protein